MGSGKKNGTASDEFHLQEACLSRDVLFQEFQPRETFTYKYILERLVHDFAFIFLPKEKVLNIKTQYGNFLKI